MLTENDKCNDGTGIVLTCGYINIDSYLYVVSVAYNVMTETQSDELGKGAVLLFEIATLYITYILKGGISTFKVEGFYAI